MKYTEKLLADSNKFVRELPNEASDIRRLKRKSFVLIYLVHNFHSENLKANVW